VKKWIDIGYFIFLGMTLGLVLTLGAFVAPTIFHSERYLGDILSHYQEGLLMSAIFVKTNYWLNIVAIFIILKEGYSYKMFDRDKIALPAAATTVAMIFLFTLYYTPQILAFQQLGESVVNEAKFEAVHKASEYTYMLLAFSLALLLARRLQLACKD